MARLMKSAALKIQNDFLSVLHADARINIAMCEQAGTGLRMMREAWRNLGHPAPQYKNDRAGKAFEFFIPELDKEVDMASDLVKAMFGKSLPVKASSQSPTQSATQSHVSWRHLPLAKCPQESCGKLWVLSIALHLVPTICIRRPKLVLLNTLCPTEQTADCRNTGWPPKDAKRLPLALDTNRKQP